MPLSRPQVDLGLIDFDNTEDMRRAPAATRALRESNHPTRSSEGIVMTTVTLQPSPALPAGADDNPEMVDNWQPSGDELPDYRCVWSKPFDIGIESDTEIRCVITQFADGSIPADGIDGPLVYFGMDDYTPADARRIAVAINAAADLAEQWVGVTEASPAEPVEGDLLVFLQEGRVTLQLDGGRPVVLETGEALVVAQHIIALAAGARR